MANNFPFQLPLVKPPRKASIEDLQEWVELRAPFLAEMGEKDKATFKAVRNRLQQRVWYTNKTQHPDTGEDGKKDLAKKAQVNFLYIYL